MNRKFLGVYSRIVAGGAKRYFFAWSKDDMFSIQRLDKQFKPIDILKTIDASSFRTLFTHEPDLKNTPTSEAKFTVLSPEEGLGPKAVENVLREHFRKAMVRFRRRDGKASAIASIKTLIDVKEGITEEHKHMFTDFGITLRKQNELEIALAFCKRTLQLSPNDDHAYFNTARVLMEMGKYNDAEQHLLTALDMDPNNKIYKKALRHVDLLRIAEEDDFPFEKLPHLP